MKENNFRSSCLQVYYRLDYICPKYHNTYKSMLRRGGSTLGANDPKLPSKAYQINPFVINVSHLPPPPPPINQLLGTPVF